MVSPVRALARLPAFDVGQDGGVLEARVHAVVQKGHSVAAVRLCASLGCRVADLIAHPTPARMARCLQLALLGTLRQGVKAK